jgi:4a-hydroxytetrahydrobiopterin dehydratase
MAHLSEAEIDELRSSVHADWEVVGEPGKIRRRVKTPDFGASMALAVRIGFIAEAEGHHPDLHVHWGRLVIDVTTHAAKGLTRNDFILAAKIDELL